MSLFHIRRAQEASRCRAHSRALACAVTSCLSILTSFGQTCTAPPAGLLGWWAGDGDFLDTVAGHNGLAVGGVTFAAGKVGQAFNLDGSSGYVVVTNAPSLDDVSQFTAVAWVWPAAESGAPDDVGMILNKEKDSAAASDIQYEMGRRNSRANATGSGIPAGNLAFYVGGISGLPNESDGWVDGHAPLPLGSWTHVALSFDGSVVRAFANGVLTRQLSTSGLPNSNNGLLRLGARTTAPPEACFAGLIDEAAVFNRALSTNEITALYAGGSFGMCKPLQLFPLSPPAAFGFTFLSMSNQSYTVEQNTNLATTNWLYRTNLTGNGSLLRFTTPASNASRTFFRVRRP